jgi:hypothetical protein
MVFFKRAKTKPEEAKADRERIKKGRDEERIKEYTMKRKEQKINTRECERLSLERS